MLTHWAAVNLRVTGGYRWRCYIDWPIHRRLPARLLKRSVRKRRISLRVAEIGWTFRLAQQLCHSPQGDWYVLCVETWVADWSILVMFSENPSVWCCSLVREKQLNKAWGTLGGSSEGIQDPSAGVWSLGSWQDSWSKGSGGLATMVVPATLEPIELDLLCPEIPFCSWMT